MEENQKETKPSKPILLDWVDIHEIKPVAQKQESNNGKRPAK